MFVKLATFVAVLVTLSAATPMSQASGTPTCTIGTLHCCKDVEDPSFLGIRDTAGEAPGLPIEKRGERFGIGFRCRSFTEDLPW